MGTDSPDSTPHARQSRSVSEVRPPRQVSSVSLGDEIVPDLKLNRKLVDPVATAPISLPRGLARSAFSSTSMPGSLNTSSRYRGGSRSVSGPASPASMFLGRLNTQFTSPVDTSGEAFGGSLFSDVQEEVGVYRLGKIIGSGGFSVVREARAGDTLFAVKIIDKRNADPALVEHEREVWAEMHHPHILPLIDVQETTNSLYLFTVCIQEGSLHEFIRKIRNAEADSKSSSSSNTSANLRAYIAQLVDAIYYLHIVIKVIHRDIKLENCLLDPDRGLQLCDFGLSQYMDEDIPKNPEVMIGPAPHSSSLMRKLSALGARATPSIHSIVSGEDGIGLPYITSESATSSVVGSPEGHLSGNLSGAPTRKGSVSSMSTMSRRNSLSSTEGSHQGGSLHFAAPELLSGEEISSAVDIWALGVAIYTAFAYKYPWHHSFPVRLRKLIITTDYDPLALPEDIRPIVARCLVKDPSKRADITEIYRLVADWPRDVQKDTSAVV